jgi:hypothetical protein
LPEPLVVVNAVVLTSAVVVSSAVVVGTSPVAVVCAAVVVSGSHPHRRGAVLQLVHSRSDVVVACFETNSLSLQVEISSQTRSAFSLIGVDSKNTLA